MPGIFATRMGEEAFQRILTTKQKTRNDLLGTDTNLTTPIAGKVAREARRKGSPPSLSIFYRFGLNTCENPSVSGLRQAQGGEPVEPQTEPPPLGWGGALRGALLT